MNQQCIFKQVIRYQLKGHFFEKTAVYIHLFMYYYTYFATTVQQ